MVGGHESINYIRRHGDRVWQRDSFQLSEVQTYCTIQRMNPSHTGALGIVACSRTLNNVECALRQISDPALLAYPFCQCCGGTLHTGRSRLTATRTRRDQK